MLCIYTIIVYVILLKLFDFQVSHFVFRFLVESIIEFFRHVKQVQVDYFALMTVFTYRFADKLFPRWLVSCVFDKHLQTCYFRFLDFQIDGIPVGGCLLDELSRQIFFDVLVRNGAVDFFENEIFLKLSRKLLKSQPSSCLQRVDAHILPWFFPSLDIMLEIARSSLDIK